MWTVQSRSHLHTDSSLEQVMWAVPNIYTQPQAILSPRQASEEGRKCVQGTWSPPVSECQEAVSMVDDWIIILLINLHVSLITMRCDDKLPQRQSHHHCRTQGWLPVQLATNPALITLPWGPTISAGICVYVLASVLLLSHNHSWMNVMNVRFGIQQYINNICYITFTHKF